VWIASVRPPVGTVPENETTPSAGATTVAPAAAPMSIPRWSPPAYGSEPKLNAPSTGPCTGQDHPFAVAGATSAADAAQHASLRSKEPICCQFCKSQPR
jgi:hypothetical protein